jgi:hypothetical protein
MAMYVVLAKVVASGIVRFNAIGPFKSLDDANAYVAFWNREQQVVSLEIVDLVAPPSAGREIGQ